MFHFTGCRDVPAMDSQELEQVLPRSGYPIRKSTGQSVFAAVRSLSQLTTSFIAYWHQGIHDALFVAWSICSGLFGQRFFDNWNSPAEDLNLQPLWFQTQLLKLYFLTTLYVDVKEPAPEILPGELSAHFRR